ncbi:MAG: radical SAM protein [Candidatus Aminicenantes bacterium]|nr:MAG: radical SAM protein [Candidatus Aminicenantes bacterium]
MSKNEFEPVYIQTFKTGLFAEKVEKAFQMLKKCSLCPRNCGVNRLGGERGVCKAGYLLEVSSYSPHFGEERPLVGFHGSGTIFMTHCNIRCLFCQNYSISHLGEGQEVSFERLGKMMIELQKIGCHNINFVTPTHYVPQILKALVLAIDKGLSVPLVYNTGGYDSVETLKLLDGVFDIYMPDFKYNSSEVAQTYSQAPDYPPVARLAFKEMHRQVGDLIIDEKGIALRGLLVRHLVLPQESAGTKEVMHFLASEISKNTYVNIMDQYHPCGSIDPKSPLSRRITTNEFNEAIEAAKKEGIMRLDKQEKLRLIWKF